MDELTRAATARFGEEARGLIEGVSPLAVAPPIDFVTHLVPRLVPWVRALAAVYGREPVEALVATHLAELMRGFGRSVREESDGTVGDCVARAIEPIPPSMLVLAKRAYLEDTASFEVVRCAYASLMAMLRATDLGPLLICDLDHAIAEGMGLTLERTETLMTGGRCCDFRYRRAGGVGTASQPSADSHG